MESGKMTTVTQGNVMSDFLFIPAYPFEAPKSVTGFPPFTFADYLTTPELMLKAVSQTLAIFLVFKMVG